MFRHALGEHTNKSDVHLLEVSRESLHSQPVMAATQYPRTTSLVPGVRQDLLHWKTLLPTWNIRENRPENAEFGHLTATNWPLPAKRRFAVLGIRSPSG